MQACHHFQGEGWLQVAGEGTWRLPPWSFCVFNKSAWATQEFINDWIRQEWQPYVDNLSAECVAKDVLMFADHLSAQKTRTAVGLFAESGTALVYGPRQKTHAWQPVDRGHAGALLKSLIRIRQDRTSYLNISCHRQSVLTPPWFPHTQIRIARAWGGMESEKIGWLIAAGSRLIQIKLAAPTPPKSTRNCFGSPRCK